MKDIIREAPLGQLIRFATKNRYFKYPEEIAGFQVPSCYCENAKEKLEGSDSSPPSEKATELPIDRNPHDDELANIETHRESTDIEHHASLIKSRTKTQPFSEDRFEVEQELAVERTKTRPIIAEKTSDGTILVDWYTTDDPANPQNWSQGKKALVAFLICCYTFVVYCSSSIIVSAEPGIMEYFGVGYFKGSLTLAIYVLAYGIGPLIWSPMSEIAIFGRNVPYVSTFAIFVILCVPTALVNNFAGLIVLRFLQGFFGSPCLANGGATMQDMYSLLYLPYALSFWVSASYCGPALGPMISGFAVVAKDWRWAIWEMLWMSAPVFILWFICLPETSASNILLRRARRLRKLTGNSKLQAQSEIDLKGLEFSAIATDALIKPIEIMIKDPAVLFTNVYTSIVYGIYYSFFEAFPLVYPPLYGFSIGLTGVAFTCIIVACVIGILGYFAYLYFYLIPDILKNGLRAQESRLVPALFACFGPTIGLFLFAWTSKASIHWIVSIIGITIYAASVFILLQCIFVYLPLTYPTYAASLFAGNDFCRSAFAFGSILYARPMYIKLGVDKGVTLLAGLSVIGIIGMWGLYFYGAKLRARSRFAVS